MKLLESATVECQTCAMIKIKKQIFRKSSEVLIIQKFQKLHVKWTNFSRIINEFIRILFIIDDYIDLIRLYFMIIADGEFKNLKMFKNMHSWITKKQLLVQIVCSNNELIKNQIFRWMKSKDIDLEPSTLWTQAQNELAERSESVIVRKAWAMTIKFKLLIEL